MKGSTACALLGGERVEVDQRARAPEMVEPVEHLLRQERRERLDARAGRLEIARRALDRRAHLARRRNAAAGLEHQADAQALEVRRPDRPVERLELEARVVARVGQRQRRHHQRRRRRRRGSSGRRRGRYRAGRSARGRRSASGRRSRTSRPAGGSSRRCRCRHAAARRAPRPPRPRPPTSRRDCGRASRDCGRAGESSTGPRTACRSRAWSSWRTGSRRPPSGARRAARRPRPASCRSPRCRPASDRRGCAILSLTVAGTPSSGPIGSPLHPARFRGARLSERALRREQPGRGDMRLERLDARDHRGHRLARRQLARPIGVEKLERRQSEGLHRVSAPALRPRSLPRHRRQVVGEDRRVLPQALELRVGDRHVGQLEQEGVDAVLGELLLRLASAAL